MWVLLHKFFIYKNFYILADNEQWWRRPITLHQNKTTSQQKDRPCEGGRAAGNFR